MIGLLATDDRGLTSTSAQEVTVVDCSTGPVSGALRNVAYPAAPSPAAGVAHALACDVAAANGS